MSANKYVSIIDGMDQVKTSCLISTMSAKEYVSIIIEGMYQAKTMLPYFYYVSK